MSIPHARRRPDGTYYLWLRIPQQIRRHYKQKSDILTRSLKTKDADVARERVAALVTHYRKEFARLRRLHRPSDDEIQKAYLDYFDEAASADQEKRLAGVDLMAIVSATRKSIAGGLEGADYWDAVNETRAPLKSYRADRDATEREIRDAIAGGPTGVIEDLADEVIQRNGFLIDKGSAAHRKFCHDMARCTLEFLKMASLRDQGEMTYEPADPLLRSVREGKLTTAEPGETVLELFDRYISGARLAPSTQPAYRQAATFFADFVGEGLDARSAFTKRNAREFKFALEKLPIKSGESKVFKGKGLRDVIAENEILKKPTISPRRLKNLLSACRSFATWLVKHGYIDDNPFAGLSPKITADDVADGKLPAFTPAQLDSLFGSPIYSGALSDEKFHLAGKHKITDHRFWMPLLGLLTGARVGELALLEVGDVRSHKVDGKKGWVIWLPCEKQKVSARRIFRPVPVHDNLVKLGFITYCDRLRKAGQTQLFSAIKPNKRGEAKGHYDDEFRTYLKRIGIKAKTGSDGLGFHSFRHTFVDAARAIGIRDANTKLLIGHGKEGMTSHYGTDSTFEGTISERASWIERIKFASVDLIQL